MKRRSKVCGLFLLLSATILPIALAADLPSAEFLDRARNPNGAATYGMLEGMLQHRRRGEETLTVPIYFGVIIMPERTIGQLLVDNRENYLLGQSRDARHDGTSVVHSPDCVLLDRVGVRASDLTMGFLYCDLERELPETTLSAVVKCRVLLLKSPDGRELTKVFLEKEHAFPLKAEFFHPGEDAPFRTLETGGFTEKNGLYYARSLRLEGPGWRTRLEFDPERVQMGYYDKNSPVRVIRTVEKSEGGIKNMENGR